MENPNEHRFKSVEEMTQYLKSLGYTVGAIQSIASNIKTAPGVSFGVTLSHPQTVPRDGQREAMDQLRVTLKSQGKNDQEIADILESLKKGKGVTISETVVRSTPTPSKPLFWRQILKFLGYQ